MPKLEITGHGTHEVPQGQRLVLAIESCGVDISHRCGGNARCTTCRVTFQSGEPQRRTRAEADKLQAAELDGKARLSCQCLVEADMRLTVLMPVSEQAWDDPGPTPETEITPPAEWIDR